jgi:activating signal cointegrator 1
MRALSLSQPWASLLVLGHKRLETRSWQTAHRGLLAIHAARTFSLTARLLCRHEPIGSLLRRAGIDSAEQLPRGVVLGTARLVECVRVEELGDVPETERPLGDFSPGRWVWRFVEAAPLTVPVLARGRLGVFELPDSLLAQE